MKPSVIVKLIIPSLFISLLVLSDDYVGRFVNTYFSDLKFDSFIGGLFFTISWLLLSVYIWSRVKVFNLAYCFNALLVLFVYLLYRQHVIPHDSWNFPSLFCQSIYYSDVVFPLVFTFLVANFRYHKCSFLNCKKDQTKTDIERPISKPSDDKFGYCLDAENLLTKIIDNRNETEESALVIGLQGKWGYGKTSYLNMFSLAAKKRKSEVLVIRFNPWLNNTYNQLAQNLLKLIADKVGDLSVKVAIGNYQKTIIDADLSWLSKVMSLVTNCKSQYADELFEKVSDLIGGLDKLLIIEVDDMDRLSSEELFNMLKLIRNVANFKNSVFIVAYDEEYLISSLRSLNVEKEYLEKIFTFNYYLPAVEINVLNEIKKECITRCLIPASDSQKTEIPKEIEAFFKIINNDITLRNVKRLTQTILKSWSDLVDNEGVLMIDLLDYILITYLHEINSRAYKLLAEFDVTSDLPNPNFKMDIISNNLSSYELGLNMRKNFTEKELISEDEYLEKRLRPQIGEIHFELTYAILKELFNEKRPGIGRLMYRNSYKMYFNRRLNREMVYEKEFYDAYGKGSNVFQEKLKEWYDSFDVYSLDKILSAVSFTNQEDWERIINDVLCVFELRHYRDTHQSSTFIPYIGRDLVTIHKTNGGAETKIKAWYQAMKNIFLDEGTIQTEEDLGILRKKFRFYSVYWKELVILSRESVYWKELEYLSNKCFDSYSLKNMFDLYWKRYCEINKGGYDDFEENFWYVPEDLKDQENIDVVNCLTSDIKSKIDSFIKNYPIKRIIGYNCLLYFLFNNKVSNSSVKNGAAAETESSDNNTWLESFIGFLNEIESPSKDLEKYISEAEKVLELRKNSPYYVKPTSY